MANEPFKSTPMYFKKNANYLVLSAPINPERTFTKGPRGSLQESLNLPSHRDFLMINFSPFLKFFPMKPRFCEIIDNVPFPVLHYEPVQHEQVVSRVMGSCWNCWINHHFDWTSSYENDQTSSPDVNSLI